MGRRRTALVVWTQRLVLAGMTKIDLWLAAALVLTNVAWFLRHRAKSRRASDDVAYATMMRTACVGPERQLYYDVGHCADLGQSERVIARWYAWEADTFGVKDDRPLAETWQPVLKPHVVARAKFLDR